MIYFDNAATTFPKPQNVLNSVNDAIINYGGNPGRGGHRLSMNVSEKIFDVRKKAANFFGSETENVVFTCNCTMALNIAIKGILKQGDHVIFSCLEHNSVTRPIQKLSNEKDISYNIAKVFDNTEDTVNSFKKLINKKTKAIICTHASNVSGVILPIKEIGELCQKYGVIFIVDCAQSAGVIKIDMKKMNIDILCTAGHKGLYGITGTGVLITNENISLDTIIEGGTGSLSIELEQPNFLPDRLESGTLNTAGIFSIGAGIDFINKYGVENIYKHEFSLCNYVYNSLLTNNNIKLYNKNYELYKNAPIVSFNIDNMNSDLVVKLLDEKGFALRGGLHCSPIAHEHYGTIDIGMVRFSPSLFSNRLNVEQFVKIIHSISKKTAI